MSTAPDYTLSYTSDHTNTGSKEVTITGIGNYTGTKKIPYQIVEASTTYLDDTDTSQTCTIFQCLDQSDTTLGAGWYLVYDNLTINNRVSLTGDVKLILKDGTTLTAQKGISVPSSASLTIYAQSNIESTAGKLETGAPDVSYPGIGGPYQENTAVTPGNITVVGGVINATGGVGASAIGGATYSPGGNITIKGGFVTATSSVGGGAAIGGGANADGGTITISDGKVIATGNGGAAIGGGSNGKSGTINISGGTVTATASGGAAIGGGSNGAGETINITGGTITATNSGETGGAGIGGGIHAASGSITIQNATIAKATANAGAGIGSGGGETAGTTTVIIGTGATITNAISYNGAGIGSGKNSSAACSVTIEDGANVTSKSTIGAGIGGGAGASNFSVTIQGDNTTVNAWAGGIGIQDGNGNLSAYGGAAIGGGANVNGGTVNIKGGTVTAKAIGGGAGIGSGTNAKKDATETNSGSITISGGTVTAAATHRAAGIGGGRRSNGGTITINGGTITANGSDAAGIGHGGKDTLWEGQGSFYIPIVDDPTQDVGGAWYDSIVPIEGTNKATTDGTVTFTYTDTVSITASSYPATVTLGKEFMYSDTGETVNGSSITAEKTLVPYSNHDHSFTYSAEGATLTATCNAPDCTLVDQKATLTINVPSDLTYDGTAKAATVTGDTAVLGTPTITYSKTDDTSFTGTPKAAGTYTASITLGTGENAATASVSYTIAPKSVTITGLSASEKVYDGTATATTTGGTIEGKVGSDDVSVDASAGTAMFDNANVGTGKTVTFSGYSLSGSAAGNYTLSAQPTSVTANITARPITVTAADQSVELGGTIATGTDQVSVTGGGLVSGHSITAVTLTSSSTANATTSGTITPSNIAIHDGSNNDVTGNYAITPANGVLTVTKIKAKVTTTPAANNRTYNGLTENLLTGGAADTSLEYSTDGTAFSATVPQGKDVNSYTVYYRAAADSNHEPSDATSMTVTISKAPLTITAKDQSYTYNNAAQGENNATYTTGIADKVAVEGLQDSDALTSITLNGTETNAGEYSGKIVPSAAAVGTATGNYEITYAAGKLTISPKAITIASATATGRDYAAGNKVVSISAVTFDSATLTLGTDYTVTGEMADDTAGNDKNVAVTVTLTNDNYSLAIATTTTTVTINKIAHDNATASGSAKYGNSGTVDLSALIEAGGSLGNVSVTDTDSVLEGTPTLGTDNKLTFTFKNEASATGKTATVTVPVTGATNYNEYNIVATLTVMSKTVPTLTVSDFTKTYDGSAVTLDDLTKTAKDGSTDVEGTWSFDGTPGLTNVSDSGTVTVKFTPSDTANYESATATFTLTINPKSVTIPTAATGLKWTGEEQTGVAGDEGYTVTDGAKTDVGSYTATATLLANYQWSDNTTTAKSIPWSIAKTDGPAAPTGLAGVAPTTDGGSDGKITGVTTDMEYSADGTSYTACTGTEITGLTEGKYYVRIKETATHEAGTAATVSVPAYGAPTTYNVTITAGAGMTKTADSGAATQSSLSGSITPVVYTANEGYYFPTDYSVAAVSGISVTRNSFTQITVSGTPTANAIIKLDNTTAKTKPATPTTPTASNCTTAANNDGKITGITAAMEYKRSDADTWTEGTEADIIGLTPGTYYVRVKATDTALASDNQTLTVAGYVAPGQVAAPTFDPPAGTYSAAQNVTISCLTDGATIHYTTDGTEPTESSPTYSAPISVSATATIKAIAVKSGMTNSEISTAAYKISITPATYAATVNNGTGDGNYAPGTTITITADAPASGKVFDKWTTSDEVAFANAASATTTFIMPAKNVTVTATYKNKSTPNQGGNPSPAPTPDTKITIPVSGDDETVNITVTIKGETATITSANIDKVLNAKDVGTVIIDASTLKQDVTAVVILGAMVEKIADAVADEENDADGLEIKLPTGTVTFDAEAVAAISEQANGKDLRLNLENIGENKLNTAQKSAVEDMDVQEVLDVYMTADGKRISDFQGGKATVTVSYTLKDGQTGRGVVVWYVAEDGEKTEVSTTYNDKSVKFTVGHFSNYVIAYDAERAAACPKDDTCPMSSFTDLDLTQWYHDGIHFCLENGLMVGVGDNCFGTNGTTSRAMIVTILYRLEGEPEVTAEIPFNDVEADTWYTDAVIWAAENEIVSGYGGGKFGPNDNITREQLATILYRYAQYKGTAVSPDQNIMDYEDVFDVSPWASEGLRWAVQLGIVQGVGNNKLAPKGDATRAQAATMIQRFCENVK